MPPGESARVNRDLYEEPIEEDETAKRACVVVLGDIGRSPRMQNHALSLCKEGFQVDLVCFAGSNSHGDLMFNSRVSFHHMRQSPNFTAVLPLPIAYPLKVLWQTWFLTITLLLISKPSFILLQNPPSIPAIPVCWFVGRVRGFKLIVDWHNYGHTILALSLGTNHKLVKMYHFIEKSFGRYADHNLCVSKAMKKDLKENWRIRATTLYDRPSEIFQPISLSEQHKLFLRLAKDFPEFSSPRPDATLFTEHFADEQISLREGRPGLLMSSTSWTEDEDFSVLLEALDKYELKRSLSIQDYPPLLCVITGKGPLKERVLQVIESRQWQHVKICTPWLEPEDYPKLIASADLGVCLHTSSSGVDLPMKIVDMFGCGLPVCAIEYPCLNELVRDGENGMVFQTADDLADQLLSWFIGFPHHNESRRQIFKKELQVFQASRWHDLWIEVALPYFMIYF